MTEPQIIRRTNFFSKGWSVLLTFRDWKLAGFPGRHPDDVLAIFTEHCSLCPIYNPDRRAAPFPWAPKGICDDGRQVDGKRGCGCHVSADATEWTNTLAIPVKPCPLGKFPHLVQSEESE